MLKRTKELARRKRDALSKLRFMKARNAMKSRNALSRKIFDRKDTSYFTKKYAELRRIWLIKKKYALTKKSLLKRRNASRRK